MARHPPALHGHEETIYELFAFVRDATQLSCGKLEKFFGFCEEDGITTGRDWWRWSHPDPSKRVMPNRSRIEHVLRVVRRRNAKWNGREIPSRTRQDSDSLALTEELLFIIFHGLTFTANPEHDEPIYQGLNEDLLLRLRQVGVSYLGLSERLADLEFTLDPELPRFAEEQYKRLTIQMKTLNQALSQLDAIPSGLVLGEIDKISQIRRHIKSAIESIEDILPFLDYAGGHHEPWVCADVVTSYVDNKIRQQLVMYVDDNPSNLRLASHILSSRDNISLLTAHTPALSIDIVNSRKLDLILLDINMPKMDGFRVLQEIKAKDSLRHIPVIAVTANTMSGDAERGKEAGFSGFLTKPFNGTSLLKLIDHYLQPTENEVA